MFFVNINFPGGRESQVEKSRKFQGVGGIYEYPLERKFQGGEGSKTKKPSFGGGGVWIFSGTTQLTNQFILSHPI